LLQLKRRLWSGFALPTPALQPLILVDARPLIVVVAGHLTDVLARIKDHPKDKLGELLPWKMPPSTMPLGPNTRQEAQ
jgi:hypothetical protein